MYPVITGERAKSGWSEWTIYWPFSKSVPRGTWESCALSAMLTKKCPVTEFPREWVFLAKCVTYEKAPH